MMKAKVHGVIGRGVKECYVNDENILIFVMSDGKEVTIGFTGELKGIVPIDLGGTNAKNPADARKNLGITTGNIGAATSAEVDVERKRINNLTSLKNGSTTGDAELTDIRVGYNGTTYPTAGEAVRGQVGELKSDLVNQAKELTDDEIVYYEHTGYSSKTGTYKTSHIPKGTSIKVHFKSKYKYGFGLYKTSDIDAPAVYSSYNNYGEHDFNITLSDDVNYIYVVTSVVDDTCFVKVNKETFKKDNDLIINSLKERVIRLENTQKRDVKVFSKDEKSDVKTAKDFTFKPSSLPLKYSYNGQVDSTKRFLSIGFDDLRDSDIDLIIPLFNKYGAKATFNRIERNSSFIDGDKEKMDSVIYGGHEVGDHTFWHVQYVYSDPLFDGQTYPTNEMMTSDRGDGKNVFGRDLNESVSVLEGVTFDSKWGELSSGECNYIRKRFSIYNNISQYGDFLDGLSNKYLGTSGSSVGSYDSSSGKYTGGIFTGCSTSANHEVWERVLLITQMHYKDQYGLNYSFETWSKPGSSKSLCLFENNGKYYYDNEHMKFANYTAKFTSSLTNKERSWNDVLRDFGYKIAHDSRYPSYNDGQTLPAMSKQMIMNASLSRKDAVLYRTNSVIDYEDIKTEYQSSYFSGLKSKESQMYDGHGSFYEFIEALRNNTSNGIIQGEIIDSYDTESEAVFFEGLLRYCKTVGIEVITHATAYDICFNHLVKNGNIVYNPTLRNTAKEFFKDATTVPNNPDGYHGNCETYIDTDGLPVLKTNSSTKYIHYGIPFGKIKFSADVKGRGSIIFQAIKNNSKADLSDVENNELGYINSGFGSYEFAHVEKSIIIPFVEDGDFEQLCEGLGEKITGMVIKYSNGLNVKNIRLEVIS